MIHQQGDVVLIKADLGEVILPVEGRQGVEFEQQQPFHGGDGHVPAQEGNGLGVFLLNPAKQRVRRQQEVQVQVSKSSLGEVNILMGDVHFGKAGQVLQCQKQIQVSRVAPFHVIQQGDAPDQNKRNPSGFQ